ncbi:MAG: hypothetical protein WD578_13690 [Bacteroidales bacterium]
MARIVIDIPDSKVGFFMELIKNLGFIKVREKSGTEVSLEDETDIPEAHQKLVIDRFSKVRKNPNKLMDWDEAKKTLNT